MIIVEESTEELLGTIEGSKLDVEMGFLELTVPLLGFSYWFFAELTFRSLFL